MTDTDHALDAIARAAAELVPQLSERLVRHGLGEIEVADGLGPGLSVTKGDALGHVEMLGVRHDVRAPRGGRVRNLVAESGEAVEYGQVVVELEPAEAAAR